MAEDSVIFKVFRFDPEVEEEPHFDTFEVKTRPRMSVLDGLFDILEEQDGSLAFRYACRGAVCGSCAMHINGSYRLACQILISQLKAKEITIRPLVHLPLIKDLLVDMRSFFEKYERIMPYLISNSEIPERERLQSPRERARITENIDCILCGCCFSSCSMTLTDPEYLGPAALTNADRFLADTRDEGDLERLQVVDTEHGLWRCHTIFNCVEACPKNLNPTQYIARLKGRVVRHKLFSPFRFLHRKEMRKIHEQ